MASWLCPSREAIRPALTIKKRQVIVGTGQRPFQDAVPITRSQTGRYVCFSNRSYEFLAGSLADDDFVARLCSISNDVEKYPAETF